MRRLRFLAMAVLFLGSSGCGGDGLKRVPVQGKLTAKGQPLDNAIIQFIPIGSTKGEGGIGRSDNDGNFTILISSRAGDKDIVPGEYEIRVSRLIGANGVPLPADAADADYPDAKESIPPRYSSLKGTPLKVTVPESGGALTIDIPANILGRK